MPLPPHLQVGSHDFEGIPEEVYPLRLRPSRLDRLDELGALKLEKEVRVAVLHRPH